MFPSFASKKLRKDTYVIVVIPAYCEDRLKDSINSILNCFDSYPYFEIIVVINHSVADLDELKFRHEIQSHDLRCDYSNRHNSNVHIIGPVEFDHKHAGVGWARKTGMDEAVRLMYDNGRLDGIIICFDADCTCDTSLVSSVVDYFNTHRDKDALSIGFEHQLESSTDVEERKAIILYELHLRYYIEVQKYYSYPFAFQTIGSAMAVRVDAYCRMGGMNRKKAGEDFYFLHKYSEIGKLGELKKALVFPSSRKSNRVPFGTGKAVNQIILNNQNFQTYSYEAIQKFCLAVKVMHTVRNWAQFLYQLNELDTDLGFFFVERKLQEKWEESEKNTSDMYSFKQRILAKFNAFELMKWLHRANQMAYPQVEVFGQSVEFLKKCYPEIVPESNFSVEQCLQIFRDLAKDLKVD